MNKDRQKRLNPLRSIPTIAQLDHRYFTDAQGNNPLLRAGSRAERRRRERGARKIAERYGKHIAMLRETGARFPVDQFLRQLAVEYTHRYGSSGTGTQPTSFNYFEPFLHIKLFSDTVAPYTELCREHNHLFSIVDFFDYITGGTSHTFDTAKLLTLPEAEILHFTSGGHIMDLTFHGPGGREFVVSGFSIVRRGSSVHWFLVGGQLFSEAEWQELRSEGVTISIEHIAPWKRPFLKEAIERSSSEKGFPTLLEGTTTAQKVILCGEFDASAAKHLSRCIMFETDHNFLLFSDDPEVVAGVLPEKAEKVIASMMAQINSVGGMWNLAEGLFQLPEYFGHREMIAEAALKKLGKKVQLASKGGDGKNARFKVIPALEVERAGSIVREVKLPHYSTETEGHWRRLASGAVGQDRDGKSIVGKTWVNHSSKWRKLDDAGDTPIIYVKDRVAAAKLKIEQILSVAEKAADTPDTPQGVPVLYILRCSVMDKEVYKVGWTSGTAEARARQLSAETGVPVSFVVVKSWTHTDARLLETEVHAMLAPYRLNERREFFQAPLSTIVQLVEDAIARAAPKV